MLFLRTLVGLSSVSMVLGGQVISYMCESGKGSQSDMALRVHYNNAQDGCSGLNSYDGKTGVVRYDGLSTPHTEIADRAP
jgi:hypothetical protein